MESFFLLWGKRRTVPPHFSCSLPPQLKLPGCPLQGSELDEQDRAAVQGYNRDDCVSTWRLRDWLEQRRAGLLRELPLSAPLLPSERRREPQLSERTRERRPS